MRVHPCLIGGMLATLVLAACAPAPTDRTPLGSSEQAFRPLALGSSPQGTLRWDEASGRTYLSLPTRMAAPRSRPGTASDGFSKGNWSYSVKQKGRVTVYIVQTPDWFEVVEQELPSLQRDFNRIEEAIAFANERYADWPLVSLEP